MRVSDLSPGLVEPLLQGRLGRPYRFVEECASTQRLLEDDEDEGTTVATDHQTQGRGRLGRIWEAPPGRALLLSVLLRPTPPMALWPELSLVAGAAVAGAVHTETGVAAELSHPNDVLVEGRKLAGILAEASPGRVVLGIGLNVNQAAEELPAETPKPATSLRHETGREWPRAQLLAAILLELEGRYDDWQRLHTIRRPASDG
jgi:BirA family biotin operon repressor/biotin-[acetyl-CoA-carboxylase] ligase